MNKWKVRFFVVLVLLIVVSFFALRAAAKNGIKTINQSLTTSYTMMDIEFINKTLTLDKENYKEQLKELIRSDTAYNYIRLQNDTLMLAVFYIVFNEKGEFVKIIHNDTSFIY